MWMTVDLKRLLGGACVLLAVLIPAALYLSWPESGVLETGAWGLRFPNPGQPPVGNAAEEELERYNARFIGDTGENTLYLTFDCGYENGNTEKILDVLQAHQAPGAFFVVGSYITSAPELVRRMAAEGHIVGNHTWSHPDMSAISEEGDFSRQLQQVRDAYLDCTGEEMPKYYRPPRGVFSQENLALAQKLGYRTVFWSLAYVDWNTDDQPSEEEALEKLTARIHPGAIVLLHNTSSTNGAILDRLLTRWEEMGYTFGSLEELFAD